MKRDKSRAEPEEVLVRCRPVPGFLALGAFFGCLVLVTGFLGKAESDGELWAQELYLVIYSPLAICPLLYFLRCEVLATDQGLKWRGTFGGWKGARWEEVRDFYHPRYAKKSSRCRVETTSGHLDFNGNLRCSGDLAAEIQARATQAKASRWEIQGMRIRDGWPRTFTYDLPRIRRHFRVVAVVTGVLFLLWVWCLTHRPESFDLAWTTSSSRIRFMLALGLVIPFLLPLIAVWSCWRDWFRAAPFDGESLLVSPGRLEWRRGESSVAVNWSEFTHLEPGRARGREIIFCAPGHRIPVSLQANFFRCFVIPAKTFAPHLHGLGEPVELGPEIEVGEAGQRLRYRFNSRQSFSYLLCLSLLLAYGLGPLFLFMGIEPDIERRPRPSTPPPLWLGLLGAAVSVLGLAGLLWTYTRSRVSMDDETIELCLPWRRCRLFWPEIESWGETKGRFWLGRGPTRIPMEPPLLLIANREHLRAELERRLPGRELQAADGSETRMELGSKEKG